MRQDQVTRWGGSRALLHQPHQPCQEASHINSQGAAAPGCEGEQVRMDTVPQPSQGRPGSSHRGVVSIFVGSVLLQKTALPSSPGAVFPLAAITAFPHWPLLRRAELRVCTLASEPEAGSSPQEQAPTFPRTPGAAGQGRPHAYGPAASASPCWAYRRELSFRTQAVIHSFTAETLRWAQVLSQVMG